MLKYLKKENFLYILLLPDIITFFFIYISLSLIYKLEIILLILTYILIRVLIILSTFFLLYIINKAIKNNNISKILKIILRYGVFYLSIRIIAYYPLFILFM